MDFNGELHEECGVFGIYSEKRTDVSALTYYGLYALQHRGQESCGISVNDNGDFRSYKDIGTVGEVFTHDVLERFPDATMAVGHVRYATTGVPDRKNAQPIEVRHCNGKISLVHNGNLVNSGELRHDLEMKGCVFHATSDTEVIAYIITREHLACPDIEQAVARTTDIIDGAYSLCIMTDDKLIAVRDPHGFRPLCIGMTKDGAYVVCSESCALDAVGAKFIRDVEPGEMVTFDKGGIKSDRSRCGTAEKSTCIFEYIYFARPDSVIDGVDVHLARRKAGELLANQHHVHADVVIGVPDSGIDAAIGFSRQSGIPYGIGFIKNKYVARTFIAPGQAARENKVRIKLNPIASAVKGKRVVLIDDSIVRGTTSARIVSLLRDAGAIEVHMRSTSPPFVNPCFYGTDVDSRENLIACNHTIPEIAKIIGADTLEYLSLENVRKIAGNGGWCCACFDGKYPTKTPDDGKDKFEQE